MKCSVLYVRLSGGGYGHYQKEHMEQDYKKQIEEIIAGVNYPAAELRGIKSQMTIVACFDI
jgi:hypothetical protein